MNQEKEAEKAESNDDEKLIDLLVAEALPEVRAKYYRALLYCKNIPKDDEMMHILQIIQVLTLLTVQVPGKLAVERNNFGQLFTAALKRLQESHQSSQAWCRQVDDRLANLAAKIAGEINPQAIVALINASLKQEFLLSTIPQTGEALRLVGEQMKSAADEITGAVRKLANSYGGVTENANKAIDRIRESISSAAEAAAQAAKDLSRTFHRHYRGMLYTLCSLAIMVGIGIGMLFQRWIEDPPASKVNSYQNDLLAPAPAPVPAPKASRKHS
jgi:hypothetical protein